MVERKKIAGGGGETFRHGFIFLPFHYLRAWNRLLLLLVCILFVHSSRINLVLPDVIAFFFQRYRARKESVERKVSLSSLLISYWIILRLACVKQRESAQATRLAHTWAPWVKGSGRRGGSHMKRSGMLVGTPKGYWKGRGPSFFRPLNGSIRTRKRAFCNKGFLLSRKSTSLPAEPLSGTVSALKCYCLMFSTLSGTRTRSGQPGLAAYLSIVLLIRLFQTSTWFEWAEYSLEEVHSDNLD